MASLMDDLAGVLEEEAAQYKVLLEYSNSLREALIASDVSGVQEYTAAQEDVANRIQSLEARRSRVMGDIAVVMNRDPAGLRVSALEATLDGQPELRRRIAAVRGDLAETMDRLKRINETNQALLRQSMELLEFDLNLFRSARQAPETANYNKSAVNTGELLGSRSFDAKQ